MSSVKPIRLCICSDTHGKHNDLHLSPQLVKEFKIDVLLHCGDFTNSGSPDHLRSFNAWLGDMPLPRERKIVICGNHDSPVLFELKHDFKVNFDEHLNHATLLDETKRFVTIDGGLNITGIPYTNPKTCDFNYWLDKMDKETHVLLTHNAIPHTTLCKENQGCESLLQAVKDFYESQCIPEQRDLLHCFGHIHNKHGTAMMHSDTATRNKLLLVNAGNVGNDREIKFQPVLVDCFPNPTKANAWTFNLANFN